MASYTPNLNLKKPADGDAYDIADENGNMDKIDTAVQSLRESVSNSSISDTHIKAFTVSANSSKAVTPTVSRFQPFLILAQRNFLFVVYASYVTKLCGGSELTVTQDGSTGTITISNGVGNDIRMLAMSYNEFTVA
jgi:hypothetical protein